MEHSEVYSFHFFWEFSFGFWEQKVYNVLFFFIIIYGHFGIYTSHVESLLKGFEQLLKMLNVIQLRQIFRVVLKD